MFTINWEQVKDDFAWDGSPRDLCVTDTHMDEWELLFTVLREAGYPLEYTIDGVRAAVPARAEEALRLGVARPYLNIDVDGIVFGCDFLREDRIELHFDPRDINEDRLPALLAFIAGLGDRLLEDIEVTPYKRPDVPFLRYSWRDCRMELIPPKP